MLYLFDFILFQFRPFPNPSVSGPAPDWTTLDKEIPTVRKGKKPTHSSKHTLDILILKN